MKKIILVTLSIVLSSFLYAQEFDHGHNNKYTVFNNFIVPMAKPMAIDRPVELPISNQEKNIQTKEVDGANSGIHFPPNTAGVKTVRYDLEITDTVVDYTGKKRQTFAINGQYPGPALSFTVGDTAVVYVHNKSSEPSAFHWHGVQLPERMDGVPFLTQQPIPPNTTYVYKFPVVQSGTYWYHSHYMLQEQIGLYGPLIFNKRTEPDIPTIPVVLSDWTDSSPEEINRLLHNASDWFGIKKQSMQSYWEALKAGKLGIKLTNEWKRMEAMDISDVYYEQFLNNGDTISRFDQFKAGDKVRLRLINGASSSYFWLTYSGGKIMVVANDGNDVVPVNVDRLIVGPSESYDLVVEIPEDKQYELLATAEDRSGYTSIWLGDGEKQEAEKLPKLKYFEGMKMMNDMMKMNGDMKPMGMEMALQEMDMNAVMYEELEDQDHDHHSHENEDHQEENHHDQHNSENHSANSEDPVILNYNMLQSTEDTELPEDAEWKELEFELTGNMNRYVWSLDNKTVGESDKIKIKQGENLRVILYNNSMMRHPMHLHGHDFRTVNKFGKKSPLKNVLDIMPMERDTIEFHASESGDWFFHCHILYHMMGGMGRIFEYEDSPENPEIIQTPKTMRQLTMDERKFFLFAENDFMFNGNIGAAELNNTRWSMKADWRLGYKDTHGYEVETRFGRYFGPMQWLFPYAGFDWKYRRGAKGNENYFGQALKNDRRYLAKVGVQYTLPWMVLADASIDHTGHVLLELSRNDIPLSPRLRASFMVNSDKEYAVGGKYIVFKNFGVNTNYDSHLGWGAGITITY